jgi:transcriptional regulator with XRE-family HTH domain
VKKWSDIKRENSTPEEILRSHQWARKKFQQLSLRSLRKFLGKTQKDLEGASAIAQAEVSKIERRHDHLISTLKRYIESLGGELEIYAKFGDLLVSLDCMNEVEELLDGSGDLEGKAGLACSSTNASSLSARTKQLKRGKSR